MYGVVLMKKENTCHRNFLSEPNSDLMHNFFPILGITCSIHSGLGMSKSLNYWKQFLLNIRYHVFKSQWAKNVQKFELLIQISPILVVTCSIHRGQEWAKVLIVENNFFPIFDVTCSIHSGLGMRKSNISCLMLNSHWARMNKSLSHWQQFNCFFDFRCHMFNSQLARNE